MDEPTNGNHIARANQERYSRLYAADARFKPDNVTVAYRWPFRVDQGVFEKALNFVVSRHVLLQCRFAQGDERFYLKRCPAGNARAQEVDGTAWAASEVSANVTATVDQVDSLSHESPLYRAALIRTPVDTVCVLSVDHRICDAVAMQVAVKDLVHAYRSFRVGRAPELAPVARTGLDKGREERAYLESQAGRQSIRWWIGQFANYRRRQESGGYVDTFQSVSATVDADAVQRMKIAARREQVTYTALLLARYAAALREVDGDVVVRNIVSTRGIEDDGVFANLADHVPIRFRHQSTTSLGDSARDALRQMACALRYRLPYWLMTKEICPSLYLDQCGLAVNEFNFIPGQPNGEWDRDLDGVAHLPIPIDKGWRTYWRGLAVFEESDVWHVRFSYDPDFVTDAEARAVVRATIGD